MTIAIFAVGIAVFLITVYGTVMVGGLLLTSRQLDDQPDLAPDSAMFDDLDHALTRARALINEEF